MLRYDKKFVPRNKITFMNMVVIKKKIKIKEKKVKLVAPRMAT